MEWVGVILNGISSSAATLLHLLRLPTVPKVFADASRAEFPSLPGLVVRSDLSSNHTVPNRPGDSTPVSNHHRGRLYYLRAPKRVPCFLIPYFQMLG